MTLSVTHTFTSAVADDATSAAAGEVLPSHWNATHTLSGTVTAAQLPNPTSSTLGGIQSAAAVTNQWINSISTSGVPSLTQPAFTNISGSVAATQMPALTGDVTTSAGAVATTIANSAVTVAKMANMAAHTVMGNNTGSSAAPIALTLAQARTELLPYVVATVTYAGTTTVDLSTYASYATVILDLTLTGAVTFNLTNGTDGQVIKLRCRQDGTGSRIWTSGANIRLSADITSIVLSTAVSKLDYIGFEWNGTDSKADVLAINKGF